MDNILTQWVEEDTTYRGNEEPSRLDLVFTKEPEILENSVQEPTWEKCMLSVSAKSGVS